MESPTGDGQVREGLASTGSCYHLWGWRDNKREVLRDSLGLAVLDRHGISREIPNKWRWCYWRRWGSPVAWRHDGDSTIAREATWSIEKDRNMFASCLPLISCMSLPLAKPSLEPGVKELGNAVFRSQPSCDIGQSRGRMRNVIIKRQITSMYLFHEITHFLLELYSDPIAFSCCLKLYDNF